MNAPVPPLPDVASKKRSVGGPLGTLIDVFASMRLSVWILLLFGLLTWAGTLAQKTLGLFVVQRDFFESFFVVWETGWRLGDSFSIRVPMPGGYLLMLLLFVNLMVGGFGGWDFRWKEQLTGMIVMPAVCTGIFYYGLGLPFKLFPWS